MCRGKLDVALLVIVYVDKDLPLQGFRACIDRVLGAPAAGPEVVWVVFIGDDLNDERGGRVRCGKDGSHTVTIVSLEVGQGRSFQCGTE